MAIALKSFSLRTKTVAIKTRVKLCPFLTVSHLNYLTDYRKILHIFQSEKSTIKKQHASKFCTRKKRNREDKLKNYKLTTLKLLIIFRLYYVSVNQAIIKNLLQLHSTKSVQ